MPEDTYPSDFPWDDIFDMPYKAEDAPAKQELPEDIECGC